MTRFWVTRRGQAYPWHVLRRDRNGLWQMRAVFYTWAEAMDYANRRCGR